MRFRYQRDITATALFLIVAVMQTFVGVSFARSPNAAAPAAVQQVSAVLTTNQNKPISVNGAEAITGATIVSGSLIETPEQVSATINIPGDVTLEIAPDTRLLVTFDQNGNPRVDLREGCVTLHTKKGTNGQINTSQGVAGKTDPAKDDVLRVCFPRGAAAPIVDAGGGVAGTAGGVVAGTAGGGGVLGGGAMTAIVFGGALTAASVGFVLRGDNPSPLAPGF